MTVEPPQSFSISHIFLVTYGSLYDLGRADGHSVFFIVWAVAFRTFELYIG